MPKLLDFIKDKGLNHEQVMKLIGDSLVEESEEVVETPEIEDGEDEEKIELHITDNRSEEPETSEEESTEEVTETIELTPEELAEKIKAGVAERLAATRKAPSKGKIVDKPQADIATVKKNWFEEIV